MAVYCLPQAAGEGALCLAAPGKRSGVRRAPHSGGGADVVAERDRSGEDAGAGVVAQGGLAEGDGLSWKL